MDNIQYDPERILNGFTIDVLKELAKRLKRKIRPTKSEIIQEILSHPRGKPEERVKVWQEINRYLRKELEAFSQETFTMFTSGDAPREEKFKVAYMFTLSSNSEIRALGEELYCRRAEEDKSLDNDIKEETVAVSSTMIMEKDREDSKDLHKRIKTLENKLQKANLEGQRTNEQLEKLRIDMVALKAQWVREKEETGKYRNRLRELEGERAKKEKEIDLLKQKLEQRKTLPPQKTKDELCGEIDLASYQGRKALIFAERDNEVDIGLNALGIIPIWAMEIDWNRPRRRMSTCQLVLYKKNDEKLNKLNEIRDIARYWNIPCNELLNFSGRIVHD
jgi:chromosome segregation ATPase